MKHIQVKTLPLISGGKVHKHQLISAIKEDIKKIAHEYGHDVAKNAVGAIAVATLGGTLGTLFLV